MGEKKEANKETIVEQGTIVGVEAQSAGELQETVYNTIQPAT